MIKRYLYRIPNYILSTFAVCLLFFTTISLRADPSGPNLLPEGSFEDCSESYNPWAGVDGDGNIHGLDGTQFAVGDDGALYQAMFGPSVAVGDLNGDGIPDLVLADSRGFFWYFPNSGTAKAPKFTQGQIIPIWLGDQKVDWYGAGTDNIVPRIQLLDFNGSGKLGLVVGTYQGKLFYIPNTGTPTQPSFPATMDRDHYLINTHAKGVLWCNYLAPFLYHWFGPNLLDLVMGEGTYSANSIYLFQNTNSNTSPDFTENGMQKIIPGMGLEQLTPTVLDWNNDGKPDILAGDRTGYLNLFLNTSTDPAHPTFDTGTHVTVGGNDKQGNFVTVTTGDLTGNKLPNLLIGSDSGTIIYATNAGKLGAPDFSAAGAPIQGVNPFPKILVPTNWVKTQPAGVPDELVTCTSPDVEPHFAFPTGATTKYALKFTLFPITDPIFNHRFYPPDETFYNEHVISCKNLTQPLKPKTRYRVHLWVKADSDVQGLYIRFEAHYNTLTGHEDYEKRVELSPEADWVEVDKLVEFDIPDLSDPAAAFSVEFRFRGQGTLYLDDMSLRED